MVADKVARIIGIGNANLDESLSEQVHSRKANFKKTPIRQINPKRLKRTSLEPFPKRFAFHGCISRNRSKCECLLYYPVPARRKQGTRFAKDEDRNRFRATKVEYPPS